MLKSFFPNPRWFFPSAVLWIALAIALWYAGGRHFGTYIGLPPAAPNAEPIIGLHLLISKPFLWFYIYFAVFVGIFFAAWRSLTAHPWINWSILGTSLIIFLTYLNVQLVVNINAWRGPFWDMVQGALSKPHSITSSQFYHSMLVFYNIAMVNMALQVLNLFFINHYVFRWRTAMNDFYVENWKKLRSIEGASQRVQEDTMRFSQITEDLGGSLVKSVMTLIAFLPVLDGLSKFVPELPLIGRIPHVLVFTALGWSIFGTVFLAAIGVKLPGLNFKNQRVEAAYRKELVYGEDHEDRADPVTLKALFSNVRKSYFRMYFHYMYFQVGLNLYGQADANFALLLLGPAVVMGRLTYGALMQILNAFSEVSGSFQYLVNSWTTIVELISIYKRLHAFEATLDDKPLDGIEAQPAV